jgi:hypothetical protein
MALKLRLGTSTEIFTKAPNPLKRLNSTDFGSAEDIRILFVRIRIHRIKGFSELKNKA